MRIKTKRKKVKVKRSVNNAKAHADVKRIERMKAAPHVLKLAAAVRSLKQLEWEVVVESWWDAYRARGLRDKGEKW